MISLLTIFEQTVGKRLIKTKITKVLCPNLDLEQEELHIWMDFTFLEDIKGKMVLTSTICSTLILIRKLGT